MTEEMDANEEQGSRHTVPVSLGICLPPLFFLFIIHWFRLCDRNHYLLSVFFRGFCFYLLLF